MLAYNDLQRLARELAGKKVLSVYLSGESSDPAQKRLWRAELTEQLRSLRNAVADGAHPEQKAFEQSVELLEAELAVIPGSIRARAWVAFIAPEGVVYAEGVPTPMPTMVVWEDGPRLAPYVRALKQQRRVIVAMVDHRRVRVYRYELGQLERLQTLRAQAHVGPVQRARAAPTGGMHVGVRGVTGADERQRQFRVGFERMLVRLKDRLSSLADVDAWIVVGGTPAASRAAAHLLTQRFGTRVMRVQALQIDATEAQIQDAAEGSASRLRSVRDLAVVMEVIEAARSRGRAALGTRATLKALDLGAAGELLFTQHFLDSRPADAEAAVVAALNQSAGVEQVTGAGATALDEKAEGVAARLRFNTIGQPSE